MSVSIILSNGAVLPEEVIQILEASGQNVTITRVNAGQPACPFCGDVTHLRGSLDSDKMECWHCWRDCFLAEAKDSVYMTRSHAWRHVGPLT